MKLSIFASLLCFTAIPISDGCGQKKDDAPGALDSVTERYGHHPNMDYEEDTDAEEQVLTEICSSMHFKPAVCLVSGTIADLWVVRQLSRSKCIAGKTFSGEGTYAISVRHGCRAVFGYTVEEQDEEKQEEGYFY